MEKALRIILVASLNADKYGQRYNASVDSKISTGLTRCGHAVLPFSYRDVARFESPFRNKAIGARRMNRRLVEMCSNVEPDLVLLGHSELVTAETLAEIRDMHPAAKVAMWYQDPLWAHEKLGHIHARLPHIDVLFVSAAGEYMRPFKTAGNRVAYFASPVDVAIERHRTFEPQDLPIDLLFCGRPNTSTNRDASQRTAFIANLKDQLEGITFDINGLFGAPLVFGADYDRRLRSSRMAINISRRNDYDMHSSARLWQLTGNGLLTFTPRVPGMERLFSENEVVYFDGLDDLVEKVKRFHDDDAARRRVAEAGWRKAHGSFSADRVCKYMLETVLREPYSEPYEWGDQVI